MKRALIMASLMLASGAAMAADNDVDPSLYDSCITEQRAKNGASVEKGDKFVLVQLGDKPLLTGEDIAFCKKKSECLTDTEVIKRLSQLNFDSKEQVTSALFELKDSAPEQCIKAKAIQSL